MPAIRNRFLFLFALLFCTHNSRAQTGCFKEAASELQLTTDIDLPQYDDFFVGEFHNVYGTPEVKLALIKYLHEHCGVNDVFMEIGHSAAWLYNSYLETGDTAFFSHPLLPYAAKGTDRKFWKELYGYKTEQAHNLVIHGMDFERIDFIKTLRLLKPLEKDVPGIIAPLITYIDTVTISNMPVRYTEEFNEQNAVYEKVRHDMVQYPGDFEAYYGVDYNQVAGIVFNSNTYAQYNNRNKAMYENVVQEIKEDGIKKFVVFSGLNHGDKSGAGTLCHRLSRNKMFKHKLATMAMACKNCYENHELKPYKGPYNYYKDEALMDTLYKQYFLPFCKYTLLPASVVGDSKVRRFSDFIILMKDQQDF